MKLYCFYRYDKSLKKSDFDRLTKSGAKSKDIYPIYAITTNKKFMKQFVNDRDMKQFLLITKKVDEDTAKGFMNMHRSLVLNDYAYNYYPKIKENIDKSIYITVVSTFMEYTSVEDICDDSFIGLSSIPSSTQMKSSNLPNPFILKDKYLDSLRILEYDDFFKLTLGMLDQSLSQSYSMKALVPDIEDYPEVPDMIIDEFRVFIRLHGQYFK